MCRGRVFLSLLLYSLPSAWAQDRIIAVWDIHGAGSLFLASLQENELIDTER